MGIVPVIYYSYSSVIYLGLKGWHTGTLRVMVENCQRSEVQTQ